MKKIYYINGSPRSENSCSQYLISVIEDMLTPGFAQREDIHIAKCLKTNTQMETFKKIIEADSIIFVFPLYIDSIPSHMLDFLYQFDDYIKEYKSAGGRICANVYTIINNGFIEGVQNRNAARIMQHFANSAGLKWRFAIGIGGGEYMRDSQKDILAQSKIKKSVYDALVKLERDIENTEFTCEKNIFVSPMMPKSLFMFLADREWIKKAKKNKVGKKEIYSRPWSDLDN